MTTNNHELPALSPVATVRRNVAVSLIHASPLNPRMVAKKERTALEASLRAQGQLVALWVRPHRQKAGEYELVDGERRWWGLQAAGIPEALVEIGEFTDEHILRITWTTGTEGKGLTVIEQARWAQGAMRTMAGATLETIGALVGVSGKTLHTRLAQLENPQFVQDAVQSGKLPHSTAYLIASVPGAAREEFAREVLSPEDVPGPLSYEAADSLRRTKFARTLKGAPFDTADAELLPAAGACTTCRFRAGNNREEYGEVKNPHTCMHTACFAEKEAAVRARIAATEAGKLSLDATENARIFTGGGEEPSPESGYVLAARPIPPDLVKAEVAAQGAPTFAEVSPTARVFVGTNGQGRVVDLVKLDEAIPATREPDIFKPAVIAQYGLKANKGGAHENSVGERVETPSVAAAVAPKAEPKPDSIAGEQRRKKTAESAAAKAVAKKLRACAEWMLDLFDSLTAPAKLKPTGYGYTRASLKWEHLIRSVPDEDALLVLRSLSSDDPAKGQTGKDALKEFVAGIGGTEQLEAVCDLLMIASALRAQGAEADWVTEWHKHLVAPVDARAVRGADADTVAIIQEEQKAKLTAIARAHAEGMPLVEIARSYELPLAEVCGMLEVPVPVDETVDPADEIAAQAELDAAFADVMPGLSASARASIMGKYAKRVCGEAKSEDKLTAAEKRKVVAIFKVAKSGKTPAKATVKTAAESEA